MRLEPDAAVEAWLREMVLDEDAFDWDEGNEGKNAKHGVTPEEVEELLDKGVYGFVGRIVDARLSEWRGLILSRTRGGRLLALIFTVRGARIRPISCRPMRESERRMYAEKTSEA